MCKNCQKNPIYELQNKQKLCRRCFIRYFEKKVLHTIKKFSPIKKEDKIAVLTSNKNTNKNSPVLLSILKKLREQRQQEKPKSIASLNQTKTKAFTKIATPENLNNTAQKILITLTKKINKTSLKKLSPNIKLSKKTEQIKPFYFLTEKEINLYSKIRKIKTKNKEKNKKNIISKFLKKTESKHPEINHAIVNSFLEILPLIKSQHAKKTNQP